MSDYVKITRSGFESYAWDSQKQDYAKEDACFPLSVLRCECRIEEGVTVGDVFRAVEADPDLPRLLSHYSWCQYIAEFHSLAKQPPSPKDREDKDPLVAVEVSAYIDMTYDDTVSGVSTDVCGVGKSGTVYSLSFIPVNDLSPLPVRISDKIKIHLSWGVDSHKYAMSLLEFLDALYWEISFYGGPEEMLEVKGDLLRSLDQLPEDDAIEAGDPHGEK